MTASAGGMFKSFTLQLNAAILALSINATSVAFGDVQVNTPATQSVTLTSTGTVPVTITGATLTGAGFTLSGAAFPATLNPGQEATLNVEFDPTAAGAATGQLTITSNSSTNGTAVIGLSGTGTAASVVAVTVTPATASITIGGTQQFAASVTGTSNTAVTWTVSGTGCSGASCGDDLFDRPVHRPCHCTVSCDCDHHSDQRLGYDQIRICIRGNSAASRRYVLPCPGFSRRNDSNKGLSPSSPWLTPNHSVNCGDVIVAASGTYALGNFGYTFGTVAGSGHCFAFLKCVAFDSCYVNGTGGSGNDGIFISQSHWAVLGFEVTNLSTTSGNAACFKAAPLKPATITDVAFIDDVANGCGTGGFITDPYYGGGAFGVDYFILIADIAYNAAGTNAQCTSGVSVFEPANYDTLSGTHIYISQLFAWNNVNPSVCAGVAATDGEGVILDTFSANNYTGQTVVENALSFFNGSHGIETWQNGVAPIYISNNTTFGNNAGPGLNVAYCGEIEVGNMGGIVGSNVNKFPRTSRERARHSGAFQSQLRVLRCKRE